MQHNAHRSQDLQRLHYVKPSMRTMTVQQVVEAMGPAQASGASGLVVESPVRTERGRGRGRGRRH